MTSTNSQDPSYDLCKDSLSFVSVPLVAPVVLQPHLGRYLLPALVRYCTRQMQWHIHVDNAQSDSSVVMLNSTHATTVRSLASKYMHNRITWLPSANCPTRWNKRKRTSPYYAASIQAQSSKIRRDSKICCKGKYTYGETCPLVFNTIHISCTTLHESMPVIWIS